MDITEVDASRCIGLGCLTSNSEKKKDNLIFSLSIHNLIFKWLEEIFYLNDLK